MKKLTLLPGSLKGLMILFAAGLTITILSTTTSCTVGSDGRPGLAYITFEWEESKPDLIDCGTSAVPPNFYYGSYYRINPGWYTASYEGKIWNGTAWGEYKWVADYEIWVNPGQRGGYGYNGQDGLNTYLNFVCTPYGPKLFRHESNMRKAPGTDDMIEVEPVIVNGENIIETTTKDYSIRITYRSVEPDGKFESRNHPLN